MTDKQKISLDIFGIPILNNKTISLSERFMFPPFSTLNAREGAWQDRKRLWLKLGIQSEVGRNAPIGGSPVILDKKGNRGSDWKKTRVRNTGGPSTLRKQLAIPGGGTGKNAAWKFKTKDGYRSRKEIQKQVDGRKDKLTWNTKEWVEQHGKSGGDSGTSIFDPVLSELIYHWFCPPNGLILDPLAGGSVRGIVAAKLGFRYHGIELRSEQVQANEKQKESIISNGNIKWVCGDCRDHLKSSPKADLLFTCPPYGNLEKYSDDPKDLSSMDYPDFIVAILEILKLSYDRLKDNRFACLVVGDFRDKKTGFYNGFIADTIICAQEVGFKLYNEAILITAVGSLPLRVIKQFEGSRKLGKTHQNVLVFIKGDPKKAAMAVNGVK